MAHSQIVGGFRRHTTSASQAPAMTRMGPTHLGTSDGRHHVLLVLLGTGFHTGRGSDEPTALPGHMYYDQEELC